MPHTPRLRAHATPLLSTALDLPLFSGERLAHILPCPLELDGAFEVEG